MKLTELMIGNIVRWKYGEDEYNIIHSIDPEHIGLQIITPFGVYPEDIEGIPLTEEWLLNFGFEEREFNGDHSVWHMAFPSSCSFELVADSNGWWYYDRFGNGIEIKHVHSLQNLFYALTGEELTIKK